MTIVDPGATSRLDFVGGLIQTAVGRVSRRGGACTKRSECAAYAARRGWRRNSRVVAARAQWTSAGAGYLSPLWRGGSLYDVNRSWAMGRAALIGPARR